MIQIPENNLIDPTDISVIFGNALDNAIEACERIKNGKKEININIIFKNDVLLCKISNTVSEDADNSLKTSKKDKNNHGFGLENISSVLLKYDSCPIIERTENEFILEFVIFM